MTDAALRHLGRYRDLYQRALAVADSATSPREVLSALALAGKFSDSEAKLLGAVTRDTRRKLAVELTQGAGEGRRGTREGGGGRG